MGTVLARSIGSLLFVVVASRRLGSEVFGSLAALSALTSLATVFVSNGFGHVVTMRSARSDGACAGLLSTSVGAATILALLITPLYFFVAVAIVGIPPVAALALLVADVFVGGIAELVGSVFIGLRKFRSAFGVLGAPSLARLAASIAVFGFAFDSLVSVALVAAVCALVALIPIFLIGSKVMRSGGERVPLRPLMRDSWVFISGNVVMRFNNDFDKLLLPVQLGAVTSVGSYALGYRLVEYSLLPLAALSTAAYPRLFRAGEKPGGEMRVLGRTLLRTYLAAGAIVALGLLLVRNHLGIVFGNSYTELPVVIGLLAGYPVVKSLTNAVAEPLTGAGHHRYRVIAGGCATIVTIAVSVSLLPLWGWKAAVMATYASELTQLVVVALFARRLAAREKRLDSSEADQAGDERDTTLSNVAR
jgi:O-antigen/teichoic acid export membrane protein